MSQLKRRAIAARTIMALAILSAVASQAPRAVAQQDTVSKEDTLGWHVVQEGETLQMITERYLGATHLWPDNAKLNPGIRDPHRIYPGQRIRVIVRREVPARQVEIRKVAREVDKNLQLSGWKDAAEGDRLKPLDGVRTRQESSTELLFDDGSSLTLGEYSQVFVKDVRTTLRGVRRGTIEIVRGQAELFFKADRPDTTEIEIVTGSAVTRPRVGSTGQSQTRARKGESGGSQVMVYGGKAEVASGGVKVAVERGMGTAVPAGAAPKPPEKLLRRPETVTPARRSEWGYANPLLRWKEVPGAASYTVEVCSDPTCGKLVARASALEATSWTPEALTTGDLYWRVTAIAPSGLDGYPSRPVPFRVLTDRPDLEPPVVVAVLRGAGSTSADGSFVLGAGGTVELEAHDDAAGVAEIRYRWDGGAWQRYGRSALSASEGTHLLEVMARDRLGRESAVWSVRVEVDVEPPPVPGVEVSSP